MLPLLLLSACSSATRQHFHLAFVAALRAAHSASASSSHLIWRELKLALCLFSPARSSFFKPSSRPPPPPPVSNRFVATGGASCHGCVMPDWLASYLFMYKPLLNLTLPLIIPFAEEMKLIGAAVNPAVRRCTVHHFKLDFFLFFFTCCYVSE